MKENVAFIGSNLQKIRKERNLSLDKTSVLTGVSKAMLAQIERGDSTPTVTTLWKIADGLKISFSSLITRPQKAMQVIRKEDTQLVTENDKRYRVYNVVPFSPEKLFEVYNVEIDPGSGHSSDPHTPGVEEDIFINKGRLTMDINGTSTFRQEDESIMLEGNPPHVYKNDGAAMVKLTMVMHHRRQKYTSKRVTAMSFETHIATLKYAFPKTIPILAGF